MKLAIFENEYNNLKASFEAINLLHFYNKAQIDVFETTQSFGDFKRLHEYDYILIDLDLSSKSNKDGYDLIKIICENKITLNKVRILTGHVNVEEVLQKKNLPKIYIIQKPITLDSLEKALGLT